MPHVDLKYLDLESDGPLLHGHASCSQKPVVLSRDVYQAHASRSFCSRSPNGIVLDVLSVVVEQCMGGHSSLNAGSEPKACGSLWASCHARGRGPPHSRRRPRCQPPPRCPSSHSGTINNSPGFCLTIVFTTRFPNLSFVVLSEPWRTAKPCVDGLPALVRPFAHTLPTILRFEEIGFPVKVVA